MATEVPEGEFYSLTPEEQAEYQHIKNEELAWEAEQEEKAEGENVLSFDDEYKNGGKLETDYESIAFQIWHNELSSKGFVDWDYCPETNTATFVKEGEITDEFKEKELLPCCEKAKSGAHSALIDFDKVEYPDERTVKIHFKKGVKPVSEKGSKLIYGGKNKVKALKDACSLLTANELSDIINKKELTVEGYMVARKFQIPPHILLEYIQHEQRFGKGGSVSAEQFKKEVKKMHESIEEVKLKDGTIVKGSELSKFEIGGGVNDIIETPQPDASQPLQNPQPTNIDTDTKPYIPKSEVCESLDSVASVGMNIEMRKALNKIEAEINKEQPDRKLRGFDFYLQNKLGYRSALGLCQSFSGEQVDAIVNAIYQIERGQALIIGDQAGAGKGRQVSALMRYAIKQGKLPIFFTEKTNLFSDIYRDLIDIQADDGVPFKYNTGQTKEVERKVTQKTIETAIQEDIENGDFDLDYNTKELYDFSKGKLIRNSAELRKCVNEYRELYFPSNFVKEIVYAKNNQYDEQVKNARRVVPLVINGSTKAVDIKDTNGNILYHASPMEVKEVMNKALGEGVGKAMTGYDLIVCTYSQISSSKTNLKKEFLKLAAQGCILLLDESHTASGDSSTGKFMQELINASEGVCYLSATFAKRPDNLPIYAGKTVMSEANMKNTQLVEAIKAGGVAMQEIISGELVAAGQMLRRNKSYEGVIVNYNSFDGDMLNRDVPLPQFDLKDNHVLISDRMTAIIRRIIDFQKNYVSGVISTMDDAFVASQTQIKQDEKSATGGIDSSPIFSKIFNVINQLLFSIKAEAVADWAIMNMKQGKKPVIAIANTLESFLDYLQESSEDDTVTSDFAIIMDRMLEKTLEYTTTHPEGDKEKGKLVPAEHPVIYAEYEAIKQVIADTTAGISISPIDHIKARIANAGFIVEEVTGRTTHLEFIKGGRGRIRNRHKRNAEDLFREFNENMIDCLLINQSGAVGASAHSLVIPGKVDVVNYDKNNNPIIPKSLEPRNEVKQRTMLILQAELDVNKEVQKRGRIFRTGQIFKPIYEYMTSAIPAEKRLMMMLSKKLKSLEGNVSSNQKEGKKILDIPDFLNIYGDDKVMEYLVDNPEINEMCGNPLKFEAGEPSEKSYMIEDKAHKASGRVAILPVAQQESFYATVGQMYHDYEVQLRNSGEWNLEVENTDLRAKMLSKDIIMVGNPESTSAFGEAVFLNKFEVDNLRKPYKKQELINAIDGWNVITEADGKEKKFETHEAKTEFLLKKAKEWFAAILKNGRETLEKRRAEDMEAIKNMPSIVKIENEQERNAKINEKQNLIKDEYGDRIQKHKASTENLSDMIERHIKFFTGKRLISYPMANFKETGDKVDGICLGIAVDFKNPNPFAPSQMMVRFVLPNGLRSVSLSLSDSFIAQVKEATGEDDEYRANELINDWDNITKGAQANRITRYIITGNVLKAYGDATYRTGSKLIYFTLLDGGSQRGILLPDNFDKKDIRVTIPLNKALRIIQNGATYSNIYLSDGSHLYNMGGEFGFYVIGKDNPIIQDKDIQQIAINDKWSVTTKNKVKEFHANFDASVLPQLIAMLWEKYRLSAMVQSALFESHKENFDVQERTHVEHDGTMELEQKYEAELQEYLKGKELPAPKGKMTTPEQDRYDYLKLKVERGILKKVSMFSKLLHKELRKRKSVRQAAEVHIPEPPKARKGRQPSAKPESELKYPKVPKSLENFMPKYQQRIVNAHPQEFQDVIERLVKAVNEMPKTYQSKDVKTKDKMVYLHYFYGSSDWYIIEKDVDEEQNQMFGYAILGGDLMNAEFGYISFPELESTGRVELDFHFEPVKFSEIKTNVR